VNPRQPGILLREDRSAGHLPSDAQVGIIPGNSKFATRIPLLVDRVELVDGGAESQIGVPAARWHDDHRPAALPNDERLVPPKVRRVRSQVDDDGLRFAVNDVETLRSLGDVDTP
jgi:hypothetical protein